MNFVQDGSQRVPWGLRLGSTLVALAWAGSLSRADSVIATFRELFGTQFGSMALLPISTHIVLLVPPYGWLATGVIFGCAIIGKDDLVEHEWARSLNLASAVVLGLDLAFIVMALFLPMVYTIQSIP